MRAPRTELSKSPIEKMGRRRSRREIRLWTEELEARIVLSSVPTTTVMSASGSTAVYGTRVTLTATVVGVGTATIPTGTVTFEDGTATLGTGTLDGSGVARLSLSSLSTGLHLLEAVYSGAGGFAGSDSVGIINTVAGTGSPGYAGNNGPATRATLQIPQGVAFNAAGDMFIADSQNNVIREVNTSGIITTIAGTGISGYRGDNRPATAAELAYPTAIAFNAAGDMFITDSGNNVVRELNPSGIITTIAGTRTSGYSGDGGAATAATLNNPQGIVVNTAGDILIADSGNNVIREINQAGVITTIAGTGAVGNSGDGGPATAAELNFPVSIAFNLAGNLLIADTYNNEVRELNMTTGTITRIAGSPTAMAGNSGDGGPATSALLDNPFGLVVNAAGDVFFTDYLMNQVKEINTSGGIATVVGSVAGTMGYSGDGGLATAATLSYPVGLSLNSSGNLFIVDLGNNVVREVSEVFPLTITQAATTTTLAASTTAAPYGQDLTFTATVASPGNTPTGIVNFYDGSTLLGSAPLNGSGVATYSTNMLAVGSHTMAAEFVGSPDFAPSDSAGIISTVAGTGVHGNGGVGQATATELAYPTGVAFNAAGDMFIADCYNDVIREVTPAGVISTYAGTGTVGYTGDNGPASLAEFNYPTAIAFNAAGDMFIADMNNHVIREINTSGIITTVAGDGTSGNSGDSGPATAAELRGPESVAFNAAGDMFIADNGNNDIREVTPTGVITTFAGNGTAGYRGDGGPATSAELNGPIGLAVNAAGDLFIADHNNSVIREVTPAGTISTVAGNGTGGYTGDGGNATNAELSGPSGVTFNAAGDMFIVDSNDNVIREVTPGGTISTYAGTGTAGYTGDGGPATAATLNQPYTLTLSAAGDMFIADANNNVIRKVTAGLHVEISSASIRSSLVASLVSPRPGQVVTFTVALTSAGISPSGTVDFYSGSTLLGSAPLNASGVATFSTASLPLGDNAITVVHAGNSDFLPFTSAPLIVTVSVPSMTPQIMGLSRYGFHDLPTSLALDFNGPMNAASVMNAANYQIVDAHGHHVAISQVQYDPATKTVTLDPAIKLNVHKVYTLTVLGTGATGVMDSSGTMLDGLGHGRTGTNFVTRLTWRALAVPGSGPAITFANGHDSEYHGRFTPYTAPIVRATHAILKKIASAAGRAAAHQGRAVDHPANEALGGLSTRVEKTTVVRAAETGQSLIGDVGDPSRDSSKRVHLNSRVVDEDPRSSSRAES